MPFERAAASNSELPVKCRQFAVTFMGGAFEGRSSETQVNTYAEVFLELEVALSFLALYGVVEARVEKKFGGEHLVDDKVDCVFPFGQCAAVVGEKEEATVPLHVFEDGPLERGVDAGSVAEFRMVVFFHAESGGQSFASHVFVVGGEGRKIYFEFEVVLFALVFILHADGGHTFEGRHEIAEHGAAVAVVSSIELGPRDERKGVVPILGGLVSQLVGEANEVAVGLEIVHGVGGAGEESDAHFEPVFKRESRLVVVVGFEGEAG